MKSLGEHMKRLGGSKLTKKIIVEKARRTNEKARKTHGKARERLQKARGRHYMKRLG